MIRALLRDGIVRASLGLAAAIAALYFIPGVPHGVLERLGDRFSTLPLWPWALAAALVGLRGSTPRAERLFWTLQAGAIAALLAIDVPTAFASVTDGPAWSIAIELCYAGFYLGQLLALVTRSDLPRPLSAAQASTQRAAFAVVTALCAGVLFALSYLAVRRPDVYDAGSASYWSYIGLDALVTAGALALSTKAGGRWRSIYRAVAVASFTFVVTDYLEMRWYTGAWDIQSGMRWDIIWLVPPVAYTLAFRRAR